jgi:Tol biopolymer transport system component
MVQPATANKGGGRFVVFPVPESGSEKMATKDFLSATKPLARSRALLLVASVALAVLVACGVAAVAALEPAKAAFPGTNGKIAFLSDRDHYHGNDIFVMDADGSGRTNLTAEMGIRGAANAAWSADGEKIAFAAATFMVDQDSDIYTMNADGSAKTNLTNDAATNWGPLSWFPSGNRIAYSSVSELDPAQTDLYVLYLGPDGGAVDKVKLTNTANYSESDPAVSPDGTRIAFARYDPDSLRYDVYVMKAEPQSPTNRPKRLTAGLRGPRGSSGPDWSPDGTQITFSTDRDGNTEIFVMNANGSGKTNLTRNAASDGGPVFSPDGKYIAFSSDRADAQGRRDIWKMGADGSNPTRLTSVTTDEFVNASPDWQPLP